MYSREELKALKSKFWEEFALFCKQNQAFHFRKNKFILYDTKLKGVQLKFVLERNYIAVSMEFRGNQGLERYAFFESYRHFIHEVFVPEHVIFEQKLNEPHDKTVSSIYVCNREYDFHRQNHWQEIFTFLSTNMQKMEQVFMHIFLRIDE